MSHNITLLAFMSADVSGNRADKHVIRMSYVHSAVLTALRGNASQYDNASAQAGGKTDIAKAYAAGFKAIGRPAAIPYKGKLQANPEVSALIDAKADELCAAFSAAFVEVFPLETVAKTEAEKAEAKAKREAKQAEAAEAKAKELGYVKPAELTPAAMADVIVAMIQSGQLTGENLAHVANAANIAVAADNEARKLMKQARKAPATV